MFGFLATVLMALIAMRKFGWYQRVPHVASLINPFPFLILSWPRIFDASPLPDEKSFVRIAEQAGLHGSNWTTWFHAPNLEGFGGIWWGLEAAIHSFFSFFGLATDQVELATIQTLRGFSVLVMYLWLSALFYSLARRSDSLKFVPILVLALPMTLWAGKLGSPELIATALSGIATLLILKSRPKGAGVFLGLAVGFKISAAPVLIGVVGILALTAWRKKNFLLFLSEAAKLTSIVAIAFLASNLYILTNFQDFWKLAARVNPVYSQAWPDFSWPVWFEVIFSHEGMHWDFVSNSGLLYWFGSAVTLSFVVIVFLWSKQWQFLTLGVISIGVTVVLLARASALLYPWYYFPSLAFILSLIASVPTVSNWSAHGVRVRVKIIYSLLILAIASSAQTASQEYRQVLESALDSKAQIVEAECIHETLLANPGSVPVFEMIEASYTLKGYGNRTAEDASIWHASNERGRAIFVAGGRASIFIEAWSNLTLKSLGECGQISILEGEHIQK